MYHYKLCMCSVVVSPVSTDSIWYQGHRQVPWVFHIEEAKNFLEGGSSYTNFFDLRFLQDYLQVFSSIY